MKRPTRLDNWPVNNPVSDIKNPSKVKNIIMYLAQDFKLNKAKPTKKTIIPNITKTKPNNRKAPESSKIASGINLVMMFVEFANIAKNKPNKKVNVEAII